MGSKYDLLIDIFQLVCVFIHITATLHANFCSFFKIPWFIK